MTGGELWCLIEMQLWYRRYVQYLSLVRQFDAFLYS